MDRRIASTVLLAACLGVSAAGCGLILGVSSWQDVACVDSCSDGAAGDTSMIPADSTLETDDGPPTDSSMADGRDAADSGIPIDAPMDSGTTPDADAGDPYHPLGDLSRWTKFDVASLDGGPRDFAGGAFDGRYVYLAPHGSGATGGVVTRLDTEADAGFGSAGSWQTFDTRTIAGGAGAAGFLGAVYDSTHQQVYLVPDNDGTPDGVVATYATTKSFTQASSWATYTPDVGDGGNAGFAGGTFDGKYVYLVPSNNGVADGIVTRVDTTQPFGTATSWSAFDLTLVRPAAKNYFGAVYTGGSVLFVPVGALVASYIPTLAFGTVGSWQTYDLSGLNAAATGFRGAAFDGQYAYLVPNASTVVARYDSTHQFTDQLGWSFFDTTALGTAQAKGFYGAAFDGRYVYLVPNGSTLLLRYDTTASLFAATAAWSKFDMSMLGVSVGPFAGAVFDGEYVYLVPANGGIVARFDARSPPAVVAGQSGSFL